MEVTHRIFDLSIKGLVCGVKAYPHKKHLIIRLLIIARLYRTCVTNRRSMFERRERRKHLDS